MTAAFLFLYVLFMQYIIPLIYAIGFIIFIHGIINYFFIGPGDEGRRQAGRVSMLRACTAFFIGLMLYAVVTFVSYLGSINLTATAPGVDPDVEVGGGVNSNQGILRLPNTPKSR